MSDKAIVVLLIMDLHCIRAQFLKCLSQFQLGTFPSGQPLGTFLICKIPAILGKISIRFLWVYSLHPEQTWASLLHLSCLFCAFSCYFIFLGIQMKLSYSLNSLMSGKHIAFYTGCPEIFVTIWVTFLGTTILLISESYCRKGQ